MLVSINSLVVVLLVIFLATKMKFMTRGGVMEGELFELRIFDGRSQKCSEPDFSQRSYDYCGTRTRGLGPELELGLDYTGSSLLPLHPLSDPLPISKSYLLRVSQPLKIPPPAGDQVFKPTGLWGLLRL